MNIGNLLKRIRENKGLSLRELSEKCGLSASFLGQIERDETSPSMRSIKVLIDALGIRLTDLFNSLENESKPSSHVVTLEQRRRLTNIFPGVDIYVLTPDNEDRALQGLLVIAQPGSSTGEGFFSHEGEEFAFLLMGSLWMKIDDCEYNLREGDSLSFKSGSLHRWENRSTATTVTLWVMMPRAW